MGAPYIYDISRLRVNNSRNAVLLHSVKPGYKLAGIKITKHDDDKGRVGGTHRKWTVKLQ